jgi:hypothetical protein
MEKKRRFVSTTDEEIEQKRLKMKAQKTRSDADGKLQKVSGQCLILSSDHYIFSLRTSKKVCQT